MWSYTYVFSLVLVLHSYFWLFIQTRYLEHCPFISKKNVLFPIISCTPHLSSQRSSQGEIWSHIFSSCGTVLNYIFTLLISEISVNPERLIWRIFVIGFQWFIISSLLCLPKWVSSSVFVGTCCYLPLNGCPK